MKGTIVSAAVAAVILAVSPIYAHAAARSDTQATAEPNHQSLQAVQTGKSTQTADPKPGKSAETGSARTKVLRRNYAIRAHTAKQKAQLAKSKKRSLKAKKQLAKSKKQSSKAKKNETT